MKVKKIGEFELISEEEMNNYKDPSKNTTWRHTKNNISGTVKGREWYHISRDRCLTKEQQFDWILQVEQKRWANGYVFKKAFVKALKEWGLY
tara:strand:+ start:364 stop:639 length:276 start_codon:yes stop_codon:yes gene_type:complete